MAVSTFMALPFRMSARRRKSGIEMCVIQEMTLPWAQRGQALSDFHKSNMAVMGGHRPATLTNVRWPADRAI
jgi:hypothetical protein